MHTSRLNEFVSYDVDEVLNECSEHKYPNEYDIRYFEHCDYGDEAPVIAVMDGVAWGTDFYDPWNDTDQSYIYEQAQQLGLIPADVDVWQ